MPRYTWRFIFAGVVAVSAAAGTDPPPSTVVIEGVAVFDPESGKMLAGQTIVVRGERIVAVTSAGKGLELPPDAARIDGRGRFALPGLIDAHVHLVHVLDLVDVVRRGGPAAVRCGGRNFRSECRRRN